MSTITYFTSESVSEGHPDKVADQISDAVVDLILGQDPSGKAAIETLIGPGHLTIAGEAHAQVDNLLEWLNQTVPARAKEVLKEIGYVDTASGFCPETADLRVLIGGQSAEIRDKVDQTEGNVGAGDQGLMFGYATDETESLLPVAIHIAHRLVEYHAEVRKSGAFPTLLPDAKSQVTVRYKDGEFDGISKVVLSSQHLPTDLEAFRKEIIERIIHPVIPEELRAEDFTCFVNPGGPFTLGGPAADCGVTGRKIIVDTYGGSCAHGGGAFSGKDPTKVDRSAAYAARWVAKNVVAAGLARRCTIQLAYAIGDVEPISVYVDTHGTEAVAPETVEQAILETFDLSPRGILRDLNLRTAQYLPTAAYGHFGRDFSWEETSRVDALKAAVNKKVGKAA